MEWWTRLTDDQAALIGCGLALSVSSGLLFLTGALRRASDRVSAPAADVHPRLGPAVPERASRLSTPGMYNSSTEPPQTRSRRAA